MAKTENLLQAIARIEARTGIPRTIFAACPNSTAVVRAAFRAAKRNNAPIYFAATLNQIDCDGGYTGLTPVEFVRLARFEAEAVHFTGPTIIAIDHGGPWLKDKQSVERWTAEEAMAGVKRSFEAAVLAGYDLIHVDPTVDIHLPAGQTIDIRVVVARTVELIRHIETFRRERNLAPISYEVGTEEVHGGLADEATFDDFLAGLKAGLAEVGLNDVWPCFIVGKVGTDLHTTTFDPEVARRLTAKVRPCGSFIKGHYTDGVSNPEAYPLTGMGAANVGPEFTMSEYDALAELEEIERELNAQGAVAQPSRITTVLRRLVCDSGRWRKWLHGDEPGKEFDALTPERQLWLVKTGCRYIWQHPEALVARQRLYDNLSRRGYAPEEVVLSRIERDMDKYFHAFNLVNLNDLLP
ncbi:class II D-tagatose-bisphosphate aldolase non-catalytic subunit [uncultured Alistipes sp.]|jgi:tagatose-1,6-bisphosphate aldolase non-catalytic subunit AgaZ/GatZ|uniref:class II D-tagatose-bisphosphate aldolase non-catalytic subunit n=1 Tax=uncultured Alistipes sp. TaxID=538949 RepID=UPI0025CFD59A|nr:class II D-tagatose-bisphosphate aldolase, non-catalytic subunit [uncultured Alistipes sp.]